VGGFHLQGEQNLRVEGGYIEAGIGQVDKGMQIMVQRMDKSPQSSRFSSSNIASDEGGLSFGEGKGEASLDFLVATRKEKVAGGDGAAEGGLGKVIVIIEGGHCRPPVGRGPVERS
jgi:hypothetical protein